MNEEIKEEILEAEIVTPEEELEEMIEEVADEVLAETQEEMRKIEENSIVHDINKDLESVADIVKEIEEGPKNTIGDEELFQRLTNSKEFDMQDELNRVYDKVAEENPELAEDLKAGLRYDQLYRREYQRAFKRAYDQFVDSNINRIKLFVTSNEDTVIKNSIYDIKHNDVEYHWKEEFFTKIEEFKTSKQEEPVELWLLDGEKLKEAVDKLSPIFFDEEMKTQAKLKEEGKHSYTFDEVRDDFLKNLLIINEYAMSDAISAYNRKKLEIGDITAVDTLFDVEKVAKLHKDSSKMNPMELKTSTRFTLDKIIKRIAKDFKLSGNKTTEMDKEAFRILIDNLGELFALVYFNRQYNKEGADNSLNATTEIFAKRENEGDKEIEKILFTSKYVIAKTIWIEMVHKDNRYMIGTIYESFNNVNVEDTYVFKKFYDMVERILEK